jgi:SAM-dependent methyltransferase
MSSRHRVRVSGLPSWLDVDRLLGPGPWRAAADAGDTLTAEAELTRAAAADLEARLRGVGLAGNALSTEITPPLSRAQVRAARSAEARRHREGSPGLTRRGARLDPEARRSLTPEALALAIGERAKGLRVLDAGCGAGGNTIGFARAGCDVTAVELDPGRLGMARHNADLYGVSERIRFIVGDATELVPDLDADLLFIDPPWGADYDKRGVRLADLPLLQSLLAHRARFARTWIKVPPCFDPTTLPRATPEAFFGVGAGDAQRVKFLLVQLA